VEKVAPMAKVYGYARVSSREQAEDLNALDQQISRLKAHGITELLVDVESGRGEKEGKRPQFNRLMSLVSGGDVDKIVIARLDRLSRHLPTLRKAIDLFQEKGVALVALDEAIDMTTAAGKFQIHLLGALAEMESDKMSERIRRGFEYHRSQSRSKNAPFGYRLKHDLTLEVDKAACLCLLADRSEWSRGDIAVWLIEAYLKEQSLYGALQECVNKFGFRPFWEPAYRRWLKSPVLQGHVVYRPKSENPEIHYGQHEAIISPEVLAAIEDLLRVNRERRGFGSTHPKHPLSGLLYCGGCHCPMKRSSGSNGRIPYYVCSRVGFKECDRKKNYRAEDLRGMVIAAVKAKSATISDLLPEEVEDIANSRPKELIALEEQLKGLNLIPFNPAIEIAKEQIRQQIAAFPIPEAKAKIDNTEIKQIFHQALQLDAYWNSLTELKLREVLHNLILRVTVQSASDIQVDFRF
jgi:DNA invertase Pin-like site-specific DNA recombinase